MWGWVRHAVQGLIEALGKLLSKPPTVEDARVDDARRARHDARVRKAKSGSRAARRDGATGGKRES